MKKSLRKIFLIALSLFMMVSTSNAVSYADVPNKSVVSNSTLDGYQFLGNEKMPGVFDGKAPTTAAQMQERWRYTEGTDYRLAPGTPVIAGDYTYCYVNGKILKIRTSNGNIEKQVEVSGASSFFTYIAYGDGKIFVPRVSEDRKGAYIEAYDSQTLDKLFSTEKLAVGSFVSPMYYHNGYIYTGAYRSKKGTYVCYSTKDDDTSSKDEIKNAQWKIESTADSGFYWNAPAFKDDLCIIADSGRRGQDVGSTLWSVNYKTGKIVDKQTLPANVNSKSSIVYYEKNDSIYLSVNDNGYIGAKSIPMNDNGTFNMKEIKSFKSSIASSKTPSTPVIYNDRMYLGGGGFPDELMEPFRVIDANTMKEIYSVPVVTSGSAALTTAYATKENNNQVYLYVVPYAAKDGKSEIYIIKDKEGQTTADYEVAKGIGDAQYCSQTINIAKDGSLIYYNDANVLYCISNKGDSTINGNDVKAQIDRLPEVEELKYYSSFEVDRIMERFNLLSNAEKAKVSNISKLNDIKKVANKSVVERVNDAISNIPEEDKLTIDDKAYVENIIGVYNAMMESDKLKIEGYEKATKALEKIKALEDAKDEEKEPDTEKPDTEKPDTENPDTEKTDTEKTDKDNKPSVDDEDKTPNAPTDDEEDSNSTPNTGDSSMAIPVMGAIISLMGYKALRSKKRG